MEVEAMRAFRDRFAIPVSDADIEKIPFYKPPDDSSEMRYLRDRVKALGQVPQRRRKSAALAVPELSAFDPQLKGTSDREISTTMSFVRILTRSCAIRRSVREWCRSLPTNRARSGWKGCSAS